MNKQVGYTNFEIKSIDELKGIITGFASTDDIDLDGDVIVAGAFNRSIAKRGVNNIRFLYQHDSTMPIGEIKKLDQDGSNLNIEAQLYIGNGEEDSGLPDAKKAMYLAVKGQLRGFSVGFMPINTELIVKDGENYRHINEADLIEVSLVTFPANPEAKIVSFKSQKFNDFLQRKSAIIGENIKMNPVFLLENCENKEEINLVLEHCFSLERKQRQALAIAYKKHLEAEENQQTKELSHGNNISSEPIYNHVSSDSVASNKGLELLKNFNQNNLL